MVHNPKTGILTPQEKGQYDDIISKKPLQKQHYQQFLNRLGEAGKLTINERCNKLGFHVDFQTGQIRYTQSFEPLMIRYELWFVRHGKTEGNTEPRIYQGQVDYQENQLNQIGLQQAKEAADKMDEEIKRTGEKPDLIVYSPLTRAKQTGEPFAKRHPEIPTIVCNGIVEMAFGEWDNVRVIDVPHDSIGHLFYLDQNALVVASKPHLVIKGAVTYKEGTVIPAESFIDVMERVGKALHELDHEEHIRSIEHPKVLMFGHSMAGAAISMLLGHGKPIMADGSSGGESGLGFDGKYIMPNATPTLLSPNHPIAPRP